MKQYIALIRDSRTGDVAHLMSSDSPIDLALLPEDESIPDQFKLIEEYDFESDRFVRAREVLDNVDFKRSGNTVNIELKPGKSLPVGNFRAKS